MMKTSTPTDQETFAAMFVLAGIPVLRWHKLVNQYWGAIHRMHVVQDPRVTQIWPPLNLDQDIGTATDPWWLAETPFGNIVIGHRKRVISIEWSHTGAKIDFPDKDVTHNADGCHAWSVEKAIEYLKLLAAALALAKG